MDNIKYFKIYSVAKSTALIVAVLPLFLSQSLMLSEADIILLGSYFFLLPLFLEIPLGVLADKYGNKKLIYIGLTIFLFSFIALLVLPGQTAYICYLLLITVSANCFSGAEDSLLLSILPKDSDLFSVKASIAAFTYYVTSILILLGGVLYYIHPNLPIIFQIISLLLAIFIFHKLSCATKELTAKQATNPLKLLIHSGKELLSFYRLTIIFLLAISGFAVMVNNRVVSIAMAELIPFSASIMVAILFILGNIVSAYSNNFFKSYFVNFNNPLFPTFVIGLIAVIAFGLMSFVSSVALLIGFLVLSIFKAAYRAYFSAILIDSLSSVNAVATILSICSIFTYLVLFIFSFLYGYFSVGFQVSNLYLAIFLAMIFVLAMIILYSFREEIKEVSRKNSQSGKFHYLHREYQYFKYIQKYPAVNYINNNLINKTYVNSLYPSPKLLKIDHDKIEWEFIKGKVLSELDSESQKNIIIKFVKIFEERNKQEVTLSHGDLHADNIMVTKTGDFFVVDWDLCENKPREFDVLTFFTSPSLHLSKCSRVSYVADLLNISEPQAIKLIVEFIGNKIENLRLLKSKFILDLVEKYTQLLAEYDRQ
ncbi:MFS transporter [Bartonella sp. DGB1]|uniref:MFS transporter n=1 Tax=Bartonella sp. DGB1 TaxID=3239807 RepID=UPI0035254D71